MSIEKQWGHEVGDCSWCLSLPATTSYVAENSQGETVEYQVCAECKEERE